MGEAERRVMTHSHQNLTVEPIEPSHEAFSGLSARLSSRAESVLREIVEQYLETGIPVGSHAVAQRLTPTMSSATIRNIMAELTRAGLLFSPHISAGRLPTDRGLRLFVDGLLQFGALAESERETINQRLSLKGRSMQDTLTEASSMLSGLSAAAGLVLAPKNDGVLKHIEFVSIGPGKALVILVAADSQVENRMIEVPPALPSSTLVEAGNYLNSLLGDVSLSGLRDRVTLSLKENKTQLDALTAYVVDNGLAAWDEPHSRLFVRGQANLLTNITELDKLSIIQMLFERLEAEETMLQLLELVQQSQSVRIYIGAESGFFGLSGMSMVVAPARNDQNRIVGATAVIGPTRLDYGRVLPVVDYTAQVIGRLLN